MGDAWERSKEIVGENKIPLPPQVFVDSLPVLPIIRLLFWNVHPRCPFGIATDFIGTYFAAIVWNVCGSGLYPNIVT